MGRVVFQTSPAYSPMSKSVQIGGLFPLFAYMPLFNLFIMLLGG